MKRLRRLALLFLVAVLAFAPAATVLGLAAFTERTVKNPDDERFKCYGCVSELTMVSADEGWAAGYGQDALHYQGGVLRWGAGGGSNVVASSPNDVWALGGDIWHYQGKNWTRSADSPTTLKYFHQVALVSPTDIWAVGGEWVTTYDGNGVVWHFDGAHWRQIQTIIGLNLQGVSMISADDGWAVGTQYAGGEAQASIFLRYQNGRWSEVASPQGLLYSVAMTSPIDGWAAGRTVSGEEMLYHYDGTAWRAMASLPCVHITRITMLSASAGWARGYDYSGSDDESALYRFADGVWTRISIPPDVSLYDLSSLTPGDAWLVGATRTKDQDGYVQGVLLHYRDGIWQTFAIPRQLTKAPDAIPFRYLFISLFGFQALLLSARMILLARRETQLPRTARRVFILWLATLLAVFFGIAVASFFATELLNSVPWFIVVGGLALLVSFPTVYLALPFFISGEDGSFRWRRQT